jgi:hypothetical protein
MQFPFHNMFAFTDLEKDYGYKIRNKKEISGLFEISKLDTSYLPLIHLV